jgi:integrase
MCSELLLDAAGRRRSPAAVPGHNAGQAPRNKGRVYPADPPTVDEIVAVMRQTPPDRHGLRLRALIVVLWRGGLRIPEALSLIESDLDPRRGSILIRRGKGNRRREVGMDGWAWSDHLAPWLAARVELPVGALFCVIDGPTRGRPWSATAARGELRRYALAAGVRRRFAPHQLRHAHAVELAREGVPLPVIQRQLGHSYVSTTSVYPQGIDVRGDARGVQIAGDPAGGVTAGRVAVEHDRHAPAAQQLRPGGLPGVVAGNGDRGQSLRAGAEHVRRPLDEHDPLRRFGGGVGDQPQLGAGTASIFGARSCVGA